MRDFRTSRPAPPTRPPACAAVRRAARRASSRSPPTRTSPSAASCSSACAPRAPRTARTCWWSMPPRPRRRRTRWRCSTSPPCIERAVRRTCRTWPRAACRCATSMRAARLRELPPGARRRRAAGRRGARACRRERARRACSRASAAAAAADGRRRRRRASPHAYAAMKLLAQRAGLVVFDLLLVRRAAARRAPSASPSSWPAAPTAFSAPCCTTGPAIDPACEPASAPSAALRRLVRRAAAQDAAQPPGRRRCPHPAPAVRAPAARAGTPTTPGRSRCHVHRQRPARTSTRMLKQYSPLVRRLAHQMIAKLPANVEIDDLIQVGMIGLTRRAGRFDAAQGVQFETFATQRIRGAMLDELRGSDWMSRGDRAPAALDRSRRCTGSSRSSAARRSESEIADEMGMTAGRVPGAARQGARHAAGLPGGHVAATTATTTSSTATSPTRSANPLAHAAGPRACARRWSRPSSCCPSASST